MRRVDVKETATVSAQLLDGDLRSGGTLSDCLSIDDLSFLRRGPIRIRNNVAIGTLLINLNGLLLDQFRRVVWPEVLHDALRNQHERQDDAQRQKNPERTTHHINPKVSNRFLLLSRDAANERNRQTHTDRRRREIVISESGHLREIAHRRFAAVTLPVGVGCKRCSGIE